jgi:hypothetical protein
MPKTQKYFKMEIWISILAHLIFGSFAAYFAFLFHKPDNTPALIRYLGAAITLWVSLGKAFNFAYYHAHSIDPWISSFNITVVGTSLWLCLIAMANHTNLPQHTMLVHAVLTLYVIWNFTARYYYRKRSTIWFERYSALFEEDAIFWFIYLIAAYWPLFCHDPKGISKEHLEGISDGLTGFVLGMEFIYFWVNTIKENKALHKDDCQSDFIPNVNVLENILSTKEIKVGCSKWQPVLDCILDKDANGKEYYIAGGFYGKWLQKVSEKHKLKITIRQVGWHNAKHELMERNIDLMLCAFETTDRKKYADFSDSFHKCSMLGIAQEGPNNWEDINDLRKSNVRIAIVENEVGYEFACKHLGFIPKGYNPKFCLLSTTQIEEAASVVLGGGPNYVAISDALSIHSLQEKNSERLRIVLDKPALDEYPCAMMFLKGQEDFKNWINKEFSEMRKDHEIVEAERRMIEELKPKGFFRKL